MKNIIKLTDNTSLDFWASLDYFLLEWKKDFYIKKIMISDYPELGAHCLVNLEELKKNWKNLDDIIRECYMENDGFISIWVESDENFWSDFTKGDYKLV